MHSKNEIFHPRTTSMNSLPSLARKVTYYTGKKYRIRIVMPARLGFKIDLRQSFFHHTILFSNNIYFTSFSQHKMKI